MKALHKDGVYDFVFSPEEARQLATSPLETDLLDKTGESTGKRISLCFANPEFGDAINTHEPADSDWDNATKIIITAKIRYLEAAKRESDSSARLPYGDVYFHVGNEEDY